MLFEGRIVESRGSDDHLFQAGRDVLLSDQRNGELYLSIRAGCGQVLTDNTVSQFIFYKVLDVYVQRILAVSISWRLAQGKRFI